MAKNKILITGGTGYLGSYIVNKLKKNLKIKLVTRSNLKAENNLEICKTKNIFSEDETWWKKNLRDVKYFLHLAWNVEKDYQNKLSNLEYMSGTIKIAKIVKNCSSVKSFICIGSEWEFGNGCQKRILKQEIPANVYGFAKVTTNNFLKEIFDQSKINLIWLRVFKIYGGVNEKKFRLYPQIIKAFKNKDKIKIYNPNLYCDYIEVEKAADKIIKNIFKNYSFTKNIYSKKRVKITSFIKKIENEIKIDNNY